MILDPDVWQSRIWRFHTDVELAGFYFLLGGQLRLLSLGFPRQPLLLDGQFVRFALLSRFVSFRHNWADFPLGEQLCIISPRYPRQPFLLGGQFVRFALSSRFVSAQQGCIFLWADSSVFFHYGIQSNLIF